MALGSKVVCQLSVYYLVMQYPNPLKLLGPPLYSVSVYIDMLSVGVTGYEILPIFLAYQLLHLRYNHVSQVIHHRLELVSESS